MKRTSILAITLLMIATTSLMAQQGRNGNGQRQDNRNANYCYRIPDLTDTQKEKIEALRVDHLKQMNDYRNQLNELRAKKHTLMTSDNSDLKEINAIIDQMSDIQNKKMKLNAKHRQDVRALLTDEQKVYFDSKPMGRGEGRGHGRKGGNGRGEGRGNGQGYNPNCQYNN